MRAYALKATFDRGAATGIAEPQQTEKGGGRMIAGPIRQEARSQAGPSATLAAILKEEDSREAIIAAAFIALSVTAAGAAEVYTDSAKYMLPYCRRFIDPTVWKDPRAAYELGRYTGMLWGVNAVLAGEQAMGESRTGYFCTNFPPGGVNLVRLIGAVSRYVNAHPEDVEKNFLVVAIFALHDEWPCTPSDSDFDKRFLFK